MLDVSIIVPVYNVDKYLERCIKSILKQSFLNWELLLINDGSTDKSGFICDRFSEKDKRIKVVHKKNEGVSATRNLGISLAKGRYITFIDSDDWIEEDLLEQMIYEKERMNVPILITGFVVDYNNRTQYIFKKSKPSILNKEEIQLEFLNAEKFNWTVYDKLYDRNLFLKHKFNTKIKIGEDMLLFWQLVNSVNFVGYVPLYKYHYDANASNTMTSSFSRKWMKSLFLKINIYNEVKFVSKKHKIKGKNLYLSDLIGLLFKVVKSNRSNKNFITKIFVNKLLLNFWYIIFSNDFKYFPIKRRMIFIVCVLFYKLRFIFVK
ncbi:glycosyltransferase family 2 protein [uncultured Megamonas sp.]|uniref:glycosyltransferase family 2 protein n=1 Tax=uncultured Megamonas sp. TaxID=286140 RepID=UPI00266EDE95|nr:glycosyltransferase family 2 protein [uncultured Megamonas sp.]